MLVIDKQSGVDLSDEARGKPLKPNNLLAGAGGKADCGFHGGEADGLFKGALPGHKTEAKKKDVATA